MALQALSEYELFAATRPETNAIIEFTVPERKDIVNLALENNIEKVEKDMKVSKSTLNKTLIYTKKYLNQF